MLIFKIAWRNIKRHKGKSLVVGSIIFLGSLIMTAGNAVTIGMDRGIEENLVKRMTGHILIMPKDEKQVDIMLSAFTARTIKLLKDYDRLKALLQTQDYIEGFIPMTRGSAAIMGGTTPMPQLIFGVNFDDFRSAFGDNHVALEGRLLSNGEHGILINEEARERLYKFLGYWIVPEGEKRVEANLSAEAKADSAGAGLAEWGRLTLMGFGNQNSTNISVPVRGIYKAKSLNALWDQISILDIESFRELFGYFTARDLSAELSTETKQLMEATGDDFLSGDLFSTSSAAFDVNQEERKLKTAVASQEKINYDASAFNQVSVILKPGITIEEGMKRLQKVLDAEKIPARPIAWRQAMGMVAQSVGILEIIVYVFVIMLFLVAGVIIMNTLAMTAIERTEELGMMRAVGARKSFIGKMFLAEIFYLAFLAGGLGIFTAVVASWIIRPLGITSGGSDFLNLFFGGDTFQPMIGFKGLVLGILMLAAAMGFSVIYPVLVARRITPLDAINRH